MKISVVGAGPSGLYFSILVKKRFPHWTINVVEQNAPDSTFGFGIVIAATSLSRFEAADAQTHAALLKNMTFTTHQIITLGETAVAIKRPEGGGAAIARIDLLHQLQKIALEVGVNIRFCVRLDDPASMPQLKDADVIVGADGINSMVRSGNESGFGTTHASLTNHFAWFGVGKAFPTSALVFREYRGGAFVAHYYPYSASNSTLVAECDHATWELLGMETMDAEARQVLFEKVFAPELDGHRLISNNSAWRQFPVIRNRHSVSGNTVLLGDAETSAHPSIGSGTRIAMSDAIALADALTADGDDASVSVVQRLERFEKARRPEKAKLIGASEKSFIWYEDFGKWMRLYSPLQFVYSYMTRTGRMGKGRLAADYPELVEQLVEAGVMPEEKPVDSTSKVTPK
ncbi:MAG: FAD-dependent monooxygenase [Burkholderiaceae bacterium]|nr:FAD-dependent monooxygenase [Burkholderiaceae bacterium]